MPVSPDVKVQEVSRNRAEKAQQMHDLSIIAAGLASVLPNAPVEVARTAVKIYKELRNAWEGL